MHNEPPSVKAPPPPFITTPTHVPRGLTFTWWGCCSSCFWHKPTKLAHSFFFCSCVYFCLYDPFNCISFHKLFRQLSSFLTLFFWSYFGPFNCVSLYESPPQSWYNPMWLTGLEAPTNSLTTLRKKPHPHPPTHARSAREKDGASP